MTSMVNMITYGVWAKMILFSGDTKKLIAAILVHFSFSLLKWKCSYLSVLETTTLVGENYRSSVIKTFN